MLKRTVSLLAVMVLCFSAGAHAWAEAVPSISARSAVVMNAANGRFVFTKDENTRRPMASTTKIMTALLTLEAAQKNNRIITITDEMVRVEGSSMGLRPGDRLSLKSLAAGMLSISGNDAANSAAIAIGGSIPGFADLMNKRAKELNLTQTHFVTPSGLDDENHYTTAHDLALLTAAAMKNKDFAEIAGRQVISVPFENPQQTRRYTNHNKLLSMYSGCIGVKTGYTKKAGRCLVSAAQKDGVSLIVVTLNDSDDWSDHKKLLDYGFSCFESYPMDDSAFSVDLPVVGGVKESVTVCGTKGENLMLTKTDSVLLRRVVELPKFVYAPLQNGQVMGTVRYVVNGETVGSTKLVCGETIARHEEPASPFRTFWENIIKYFTK